MLHLTFSQRLRANPKLMPKACANEDAYGDDKTETVASLRMTQPSSSVQSQKSFEKLKNFAQTYIKRPQF
jgi:hypothetical protein